MQGLLWPVHDTGGSLDGWLLTLTSNGLFVWTFLLVPNTWTFLLVWSPPSSLFLFTPFFTLPPNLFSVFPGLPGLGPLHAEQVRLPALLVNVQARQVQEEEVLDAELLGDVEPQAEQARLPPLLFNVQAWHCQDGMLGAAVVVVAHPSSEPFLAANVSLLVWHRGQK